VFAAVGVSPIGHSKKSLLTNTVGLPPRNLFLFLLARVLQRSRSALDNGSDTERSRATAQTKETMMSTKESSSALIWAVPALCGGAGLLAAALIAGMATLLPPNAAQATPTYAAQWKLTCGQCHVSPAGGGALTDWGKAFAANGHKPPR
jgi:hypothetical protein